MTCFDTDLNTWEVIRCIVDKLRVCFPVVSFWSGDSAVVDSFKYKTEQNKCRCRHRDGNSGWLPSATHLTKLGENKEILPAFFVISNSVLSFKNGRMHWLNYLCQGFGKVIWWVWTETGTLEARCYFIRISRQKTHPVSEFVLLCSNTMRVRRRHLLKNSACLQNCRACIYFVWTDEVSGLHTPEKAII